MGLKSRKNGNNIVILDDGLQDYKIEKDLCISCFHQPVSRKWFDFTLPDRLEKIKCAKEKSGFN